MNVPNKIRKIAKKLKNCCLYGGYLKDIPKPHYRRYDIVDEKIPIGINIIKYYGVGVHYHVSFGYPCNPILNVKTKEWQSPWEDKDRYYKLPSEISVDNFIFKDEDYMIEKIKDLVKKYFPSNKFEITYNDYSELFGKGD